MQESLSSAKLEVSGDVFINFHVPHCTLCLAHYLKHTKVLDF